MNIIRNIKDFGWFLFERLPYKLHYYLLFIWEKKRLPCLMNPQDYSDFVFRDSFYGRHNKYAYLADKYEVRQYVEGRGLGKTLTKLYGVWDDANIIDFDKLPNGFALKCNHSCGMNIICTDKYKLDIDATRKQLNEWLKMKHPKFFEQHYNHIKPMIICEELIQPNTDGSFPNDYKIHCANGKPVFIQICFERTEKSVGYRKIYSNEWKDLHYVVEDYHYSKEDVPAPKHLKEMLEDAAILSEGLDYARIDFYDTDDRVIFGEVTLTPMGGWLSYFTQEARDKMGEEIRKGLKK